MKRFLTILVVLIALSASVYADIEFDFLTSLSPVWIKLEDRSFGSILYPDVPKINGESIINWYFLSLGKKTALGLSIDTQYGSEMFIAAAPIVRYSINDANSLSCSIGAKEVLESIDPEFHYYAITANLAYKHWLKKQTDIQLGIMAGAGMDFLFSGTKDYPHIFCVPYTSDDGETDYDVYSGYIKHNLTDGSALHVFVGICMNLGDFFSNKR